MRALVEVSSRAERDFKRLGPGPERKAVRDALMVGLRAVPPPGNLNIKAIEGAPPYLRLRVSDYRVIYRPLAKAELAAVCEQKGQRAELGYLVARIVHRRELDRAVASLL